MSYFDNANTTVTRKSFGSKVDKTFQREGVVPVKDRKKDEKDVVAESTKYNELNKKVENRRMNNMVENRKYEIKLQEGYTKLKDELIKDFLSEICIESLLVDENVVTANLKNIVSMVEEKVDTIGGFEGVKDTAESTQNPILLNMVSICEAVCKKVGERNLKESDKNAEKLDFSLNKDEMNDFDYRKKEMGTESIVNTIKDKVFQVVQDEQKLNTERQEVMTEIENKVQELNAPVQEAMDFIFNQNKIEETTLFDSLMRSHYKQLLETESSAIFESMDYQEEDKEIVFEEQEFSMSDVELEGCKKKKCGESYDECEDDDDDEYDDDEYDEDDDDECEDGECVEEAINQKKFQKKSRKMSDAKLQNKIVKWEKDIAATKAKIKQESDPDYLNDYKEDLKILNAELKVFKNELAHRAKQAKVKTNPYAKESLSEIFESLYDDETIDVDNITEAMDKFVVEIKDDISDIKSKSEAVACKESIRNFQADFENVLNEGLSFKMLDGKIANFFNNLLSKKLAKRDYAKVREQLKVMLKGNLTLEEVKTLEDDLRIAKEQLTKAKQQQPQAAADIDEHLKWLNSEYKQMLANKKKELTRKTSMTESVNGLPTVESVFALMEARCGKKMNEACGDKKTCEACGKKMNEACGNKKTCEACGKKMNEACGNKKTCEACGKKVKEEVIVCPDCGKEKCICDEACKAKKACKESQEYIEEGLKGAVINKMGKLIDNLWNKKVAKRDFEQTRIDLTQVVKGASSISEIKMLEQDMEIGISQLMQVKEKQPAYAQKIDNHIKWLKTDYKKMLADQKKYLMTGKTMESQEYIEEGLKDVVGNLINKIWNKKVAKRDFEQIRIELTQLVKNTASVSEIKMLEQDMEIGINQLTQVKEKQPEYSQKIDNHIKWLKSDYKKMLADKKKQLMTRKTMESFMCKLDECCESLNMIIETHEIAYNNVLESLTFEVEDKNTLIPYLQAKDCEMSNLEFAYKTKLVCETLKDSLKTIENNNDLSVLNKAVELNINSINETMEIIKDNESLSYKNRILNSGRQYLTKLHNIIESIEIPETELTTTMESSVFNSEEDVEKIFNMVKEYYVIESTDKDMMELVMAEAIVDYTIMEAFNTLNLVKYDKEIVRQMSRNNLNK